jgi:LCP family protein required for cell wall assembly
MTVPASGVRPRRTWPQRILIAANLAIIVACLSGAGTLGWFYYQFGQLPRLDLAKGTLAPEQPAGDPQNFLLVGSDSRAFVDNPEDQKSFGTAAVGTHADTIMLVRVDPRAKTVSMVSFPRDLYLPIARTNGHRDRINTAFNQGPEQLIDTITQNFNVPIHHYAQVDFRGFKGLVDAVGGVKVFLAAPVRDYDTVARRNQTGLNIPQTGCLELNGTQALAYVRSRHLQTLVNGRWVTDQTGDFGRIKRQQDFVIRAVREALTKDLLNPARANRLAQVAVKNAKISQSLDLRDILELGKSFHTLDPSVIQQSTLPVQPFIGGGGAYYLRIDPKQTAEAEAILDIFRGVAPAPNAPASPTETNVQVMNGTGIDGLAGDTSAQLQQLHFGVGTPGTTKVATTTTIRYAPGQQAKAELLARYLKSESTLLESPGQKVDLQLVLGQGFAGVLAEPKAPAPATTTTAPAKGATTTVAPSPQC